MRFNFNWGPVIATFSEKEEIETTITEDLLANYPIAPPHDGIVKISLFPDEPVDFKILGAATDINAQLLFKFSYFGMSGSSSIVYDLPDDSSKGRK